MKPKDNKRDRLKGFKQSHLVRAWLVLTLAILFGGTLAAVEIKLGPMIEANKRNETLEQVPELILGKALAAKMAAQEQHLTIESHLVAVAKAGRTVSHKVYTTRYQNDLRGYVVKGVGQGYADRIELLLGLDPMLTTITGLFILEQKETPGLGNKITIPGWRNQVLGKKLAQPLTVTKKGATAAHEIDAITGATISSQSVITIINTLVADLKPHLGPSALVTVEEKR